MKKKFRLIIGNIPIMSNTHMINMVSNVPVIGDTGIYIYTYSVKEK